MTDLITNLIRYFKAPRRFDLFMGNQCIGRPFDHCMQISSFDLATDKETIQIEFLDETTLTVLGPSKIHVLKNGPIMSLVITGFSKAEYNDPPNNPPVIMHSGAISLYNHFDSQETEDLKIYEDAYECGVVAENKLTDKISIKSSDTFLEICRNLKKEFIDESLIKEINGKGLPTSIDQLKAINSPTEWTFVTIPCDTTYTLKYDPQSSHGFFGLPKLTES